MSTGAVFKLWRTARCSERSHSTSVLVKLRAIALAAEMSGALLIMDDADGRRVARGLGLRVTGVLGVLVEAKCRGFLSEIKPILDALSAEGFWLSESLRRSMLDAVEE